MSREVEIKHLNLVLSHISIYYISPVVGTDESLCGIKDIPINSVLWYIMYNRREKSNYDRYTLEGICKKCIEK